MKTILMYLEYDGTNFYGYQKQLKDRTVQEELEKAMKKLFGRSVPFRGSSRTDQGVHAREYPVTFKIDTTIPPEKIAYALNTYLPEDIRALQSMEMPTEFDARWNASGKTYSYHILNRPMASALLRNHSYWVRTPLDIKAMREAAEAFLGTHDFTGFKSLGSSDPNPIKEMTRITVTQDGDFIILSFTGSGFLYNMARIMAGTLIDVGFHKITKEEIQEIFKTKLRGRSIVVPSQGLYLDKVYFRK
ncbi:MAG: tRNA pseudouridine(38-40) synthase TruA [Clostridium sp.]|jgi:tRNA pseudouridine38-40 synthase|nr:tRNA pseudouridine(38-40) synthase TruA [Clostridium sp.]